MPISIGLLATAVLANRDRSLNWSGVCRSSLSPADLAKIVSWLSSEGFEIISTGRGRRYVAFNATAEQIRSALYTEIHTYRVDDELHFADATPPEIPAAIQDLVLEIGHLNDFRASHMPVH